MREDLLQVPGGQGYEGHLRERPGGELPGADGHVQPDRGPDQEHNRDLPDHVFGGDRLAGRVDELRADVGPEQRAGLQDGEAAGRGEPPADGRLAVHEAHREVSEDKP